jgi:DNA modification methylase
VRSCCTGGGPLKHDETSSADARRIEYLPLSSLRGAKRNPKKHADAEVRTSIDRFGYVEPMVLDERTGTLVAGHGRREALSSMREKGDAPPAGVKADGDEWLVPVLRGWESRSDAEAEAYLVASNQLTIAGGWDNKELTALLSDLAALGPDTLLGTGFDEKSLGELLDEVAPKDGQTDPNDVPDKIGHITVEPGQAYRLGDHLLVCGDSTDPGVYDRLMQGSVADIIWTDPPWNVAYDGKESIHRANAKGHEEIANDDLGEAFPGFCAAFCNAMVRHVKPGAPIYLAMSTQEWPTIHAALLGAGFHWSSTIVWAKESFVIGRKDYHAQFEPLWYGWQKGAARLVPVEDRSQSDLWTDIPRPKKSDDHPTMKPVELIERALKNSSAHGALVLEPFSGSGSVIMACERTGRRARAIELMPKYVQTTIVRWEEFTGKKAERVS